jgi:hypothetical protein
MLVLIIVSVTCLTLELAYNEATGEVGYYPITAFHENLDPVTINLTIDNDPTDDQPGLVLETTPEHPFYVNGTWVNAGDLTVGTVLTSFDGEDGIIQLGTITATERIEQEQIMYNLTVDTAHTFFVGEGQWLVHNCPSLNLANSYTFNRGQRQFMLNQGDSSSGWTHIWERHIDPMPGNSDFLTKSKFDPAFGEVDITDLLGSTLKHGKESDYYGLSVFEYKTNYKGTGYQTYRATVNSDGTVRTFHPVTCPPECQ